MKFLSTLEDIGHILAMLLLSTVKALFTFVPLVLAVCFNPAWIMGMLVTIPVAFIDMYN